MKKLLLFLAIIFSSNAFAVEFKGKFLQGHFIIGITDPSSKIIIDKKEVRVSKDGYFVFGIDRDRKFDVTITKVFDGKKEKFIKKILKRKYNIQRIDGLEESKVTPPESVYKRIKKKIIKLVKQERSILIYHFLKTSLLCLLKVSLAEFTEVKEF